MGYFAESRTRSQPYLPSLHVRTRKRRLLSRRPEPDGETFVSPSGPGRGDTSYKIFEGHIHVDKNRLFPGPNTTHTRRNSKAIYKQRSRTNIRRHSFSRRVVDHWNKLPDQIVTAPSINSFKNRINKLWVGGPDKFRPNCLN